MGNTRKHQVFAYHKQLAITDKKKTEHLSEKLDKHFVDEPDIFKFLTDSGIHTLGDLIYYSEAEISSLFLKSKRGHFLGTVNAKKVVEIAHAHHGWVFDDYKNSKFIRGQIKNAEEAKKAKLAANQLKEHVVTHEPVSSQEDIVIVKMNNPVKDKAASITMAWNMVDNAASQLGKSVSIATRDAGMDQSALIEKRRKNAKNDPVLPPLGSLVKYLNHYKQDLKPLLEIYDRPQDLKILQEAINEKEMIDAKKRDFIAKLVNNSKDLSQPYLAVEVSDDIISLLPEILTELKENLSLNISIQCKPSQTMQLAASS